MPTKMKSAGQSWLILCHFPSVCVHSLLQESPVKVKKKKPGIIYLSSIPEVGFFSVSIIVFAISILGMVASCIRWGVFLQAVWQSCYEKSICFIFNLLFLMKYNMLIALCYRYVGILFCTLLSTGTFIALCLGQENAQ